MTHRLSAGAPEPLGVTPDANGVNVAVFSAHATSIEFCLFDKGDRELHRVRLPERTGDVFHGHLAGVKAGDRYGIRAHGPFAPHEGHRFNAAKLLVDPHARLLDRPFRLHLAMFGYPEGADDLAFDGSDSAPFVPKALVTAPAGPRLGHAAGVRWGDTIIYELHVRGYTKLHTEVSGRHRGTFAGLREPAALDHLVKLGVTTVEVLPSAAWIEERHLARLGLSNYWGYNPVALMAPEPRLAPGGWDEVRRTVEALASAGIETIVDVVLNHSGEGDELGPTLSLRGLDNASYYRLRPDQPRRYIDDSGCGNTLALDRPPVVRLAMDALRTWAREAGVHGFRFDLAACMGRRGAGEFDPAAPLLTAIRQDPELALLKLIAEPWDIGPGGYQLGHFPPGWGEWNDLFRDDVRRFWRGDRHQLGALATRIAGSADVMVRSRPLSRSVNFVTAHDGFSLADLVAHAGKRNVANGEGNRDGTDANFSWNSGCEGPTDDPDIRAARRSDQRALLATLLLARGTPMLSMGAELGHSQSGNNNCYAQDNELSWLKWADADGDHTEFVSRAIALRRQFPLLRGQRPLTGEPDLAGVADVEWLSPEGRAMSPQDWDTAQADSFMMLLNGGSDEATVGVLIHRGRGPIPFVLPKDMSGRGWRVLLDSSDGGAQPGPGYIEMARRSVVLVAEEAGSRQHTGVTSATLDLLSQAAGIQPEWWSVAGERHVVSEDTRRHLLGAMGLGAASEAEAREALTRLSELRDRRPLPCAVVSRSGAAEITLAFEEGVRRPVSLIVESEDGETRHTVATGSDTRSATGRDGRPFEQRRVVLPALPTGHYLVWRDDLPDVTCRLTVAPGRAYLPHGAEHGEKYFGLAAQLYSLRRAGDQGIGDFSTLRELTELAATAGAAAVGINPLHALFPDERSRASPYYPSDRRFLDPIYLDLAALTVLPGGDALRATLSDSLIAELQASPLVDYERVWALKCADLRAFTGALGQWLMANPGSALAKEFEAFVGRGGAELHTFAMFCAISASRSGADWRNWPDRLRARDSHEIAQFAAGHREEVRFHVLLQWLCDRQLAAAAAAARGAGMAIGLYRDLAVGAAPDGAEVWAHRDLIAAGASIGAPPDPLGPQGQIWGLPPPNPHAQYADGYRAFDRLLAANMAHAGALRIDHAMGLSRLFWVPEGASAADGAYVSYPFDDLLGRVALTSRQAATVVIGEDLGTVPEGFRTALADTNLLGYRVMLLEREGCSFRAPASFPRLSLACITSHDLPTLAGWWSGRDISERETLGQYSPERGEALAAEREVERAELAAAAEVEPGCARVGRLPQQVLESLHLALGRAGSLLVMAQLEELAGEEIAINLPGTDAERPNWRRKLSRSLPGLFSGTSLKILQAVASSRTNLKEQESQAD